MLPIFQAVAGLAAQAGLPAEPQARISLSAEQGQLVVMIVKLAIMATLATMLVRFRLFRRILVTEHRGWPERLTFAMGLGLPLCAGVLIRLTQEFKAADLTLAGSFLAGLIAGPYSGALVGLVVGLPPTFVGEYASLPFAIGCGFAGSGLRELVPRDQIWRFSPFFVTNLYKSAWRLVKRPSFDWQIVLVTAPVLLEILLQALGRQFKGLRVNYLAPLNWWLWPLLMLDTVLCVAIPIKIWNNARIEHKLAEQEKLLLAARVEALANQINPHFLFNTLTSISSLIRSQPDTARMLIVKLSALLRRLLRSEEHFVSLREELEAVDEYLDIEKVRFGPTQLVIEREIDERCLGFNVPSMMLQPLVENSIKHGLGRKVGEGRILIRATRHGAHAVIEVTDNGIGMTSERLETTKLHGIGLRNVDERLRVIYGESFGLKITSVPGQGTQARIEIPELAIPDRVSA